MTHSEHRDHAPSGSIHVTVDGEEAEFRRLRQEICDAYARSEGTRLPGQLGKLEYALAVISVVAAFVGILLFR